MLIPFSVGLVTLHGIFFEAYSTVDARQFVHLLLLGIHSGQIPLGIQLNQVVVASD
ncbi:hypothetical protein PDO_5184 [Rhizobium sp. PDO1-076]|nr:hypothetical protein PDO_5184 [Rhizobium sp. PDO1-076]